MFTMEVITFLSVNELSKVRALPMGVAGRTVGPLLRVFFGLREVGALPLGVAGRTYKKVLIIT